MTVEEQAAADAAAQAAAAKAASDKLAADAAKAAADKAASDKAAADAALAAAAKAAKEAKEEKPGDGGNKLFERLVELQDKIEANLGTKLGDKLAAQFEGVLAKLVDDRLKTVETTLKGQTTKAQNDLTETLNGRLIAGALRHAAEAAGAHDFDTLNAMIDKSAIKVGEDGIVTGLAEAMTKLQTDKKFLFGEPKITAGTGKTPKPGDPPAKSVKDMSADDWAAEKRRLGVR